MPDNALGTGNSKKFTLVGRQAKKEPFSVKTVMGRMLEHGGAWSREGLVMVGWPGQGVGRFSGVLKN